MTTQLYVEGDPGNERDFVWRSLRDRSAVTVPVSPSDEGLRALFGIVIAA